MKFWLLGTTFKGVVGEELNGVSAVDAAGGLGRVPRDETASRSDDWERMGRAGIG